jgi:hypothetical protein
MNAEHYFRSVTSELETLKDRVRHFIDDGHWPTDGEWKESVLRSVVKRSAPGSITVGRGFIVHGAKASTQIDVLIYDNEYPVLYRDGDLVFITPDACRAIVEVKTTATPSRLDYCASQLADAAAMVRRASPGRRLFVGLFVYEDGRRRIHSVLDHLHNAAGGIEHRVINHVSLGPSTFAKFWEVQPGQDSGPIYDTWHEYQLERMAPGYFIHNLLVDVSPSRVRRDTTWFPETSKEARLLTSKSLARGVRNASTAATKR